MSALQTHRKNGTGIKGGISVGCIVDCACAGVFTIKISADIRAQNFNDFIL